jgi:uncharacterized RDD family membrane protein YckC
MCSASHVPGIIAVASEEAHDDVPRVSTSFPTNSQEPMAPEPYYPDEQERWRNEVASRISSYKARRRRKMEGDFSMKLEFEASAASTPSEGISHLAGAVADQKTSGEVCDTNYYRRMNAEAIAYSAAAAAKALEDYDPDFDFVGKSAVVDEEPRIHDPLNAEIAQPTMERAEALAAELDAILAEPEVSPTVVPQTTNNVILFPRPTIEPPLAPLPPTRDELADRVFDRPRILDVPEDNVPTIEGPLFADIHLDSETEEMMTDTAKVVTGFEIPLQVAPMMQRAFAAACDWGIVTIASIVFFVLSWKSLDGLPTTKPGIAALLMIPIALWTVYQFLFHLYAAETPGMRFAHLRLCDFQRETPEWDQRKRRALYATLSCLAVGVGYLWALIDEDTLCWHDRASRTYLTQE